MDKKFGWDKSNSENCFSFEFSVFEFKEVRNCGIIIIEVEYVVEGVIIR